MNNDYSGGSTMIMHSFLPPEYLKLIRSGYFDEKGIIKEDYLWKTTKDLTKRFNPGQVLTSTQLRNFFNHVKLAKDTYKDSLASHKDLDAAGRVLMSKIRALDCLIHNAKGKQDSNIPDSFFEFIVENVKACESPKDVIDGFALHFQSVLGYSKYFEALKKIEDNKKKQFKYNGR